MIKLFLHLTFPNPTLYEQIQVMEMKKRLFVSQQRSMTGICLICAKLEKTEYP